MKTKLYVPPVRPELVSRPRLIERLDAGLHRKLTLVSAPAGFGKTTLLSEWAAGCERPVAWLSLDKDDNDLARFWVYFVAALQTVQSDVGGAVLAALQSRQPPPIETVLTSVINEIATIPDGFILVLDDYHLIEAQPIHDALTFWLGHLPRQMHLVIASRADPPLPLSRLRGRGQLSELRTADLRFTSDEAVIFLNQVMGLELSAEEVAALEGRTEGWIVGLQMAALSLREQDAERVGSFVAAFTGSHRYVLDYLTDEVLLQQPESVQTFLLRTAILSRLTGSLCDVVVGNRRISESADQRASESANQRFGEAADGRFADSQICRSAHSPSVEILEYLERNNLFLVLLDDDRCWYRYHHLFADLLRKRLEQTQPDRVPLLHRRASRWYEMKGMIAEAVRHALAAGDADRVARLVERNALAMMDHGELATLLGLLSTLPEPVLRRRPWLCVAYAWALVYSGQLDAVEPMLQDAERAVAGVDEAVTKVEHSDGHIATIRTYVATLRGEYVSAAESARKALELLPEDDLATRGFAASQLAFALRTTDGLAAATRAAIEASTISQAAGDSHVAVMTLCDLAGLLNLQGRLHEAAETYRDALRLTEEYAKRSGRQLPVAGYVYGRMSTILREWNDLEAAVHLARKGVELCKRWGWTEPFVDCCFYLAAALQAAGDRDGALNVIQEAKQAARGLSPWYATVMDLAEVRMQLALGDLASASRWAAAQEDESSIGNEPYSQYVVRYLMLVRILIAQAWAQTGEKCDRVDSAWNDKLERALESLTWSLQRAEDHCFTARVIEIHIRQALILQALGRVEQALPVLERVLAITESGGHVRVFVSKGAPMEKLLRQAAARGIAVERVGKLLTAFKRVALPSFPPSLLIEPLSERELEVLRLIAAGLSNREIAAELVLTVGTVKRHASNIYGKLNVHKRTQAVARARELGLL